MNAYAPAIVGGVALLAALVAVLFIANRPPLALRKLRAEMRRQVHCKHQWLSTGPYKRRCPRCDKHEMLFENRHPAIGEPKYEWR